MKIIGHVYEEDNYDLFVRLEDNRDVLSGRVGKLIASMKERYICNPIIVNEKMEVIDGQGRFEARKAMGKPIHFIIVEGTTSDDCRRMNKYNSTWTVLDFARSYAKTGISSYIRLLETCKTVNLPISTVLRLSNHGTRKCTTRTEKMSNYEKGLLSFTAEDSKVVNHVTQLADEINNALQFTGRINDAFRCGVKVMVETPGYSHNRMLRNCKNERANYAQMSRLVDQLVEFERIYNKRAKTSEKLYFSEYMRNKGSNVRDYDNSYSPYNDFDTSTLPKASNS